METDLIIGIVVLVISVGLLILLAIWARTIINRISRKKFSSAREAMKELGIG